MSIGSKVYYNKNTGNVLIFTNERSNDIKLSKEEEYSIYDQLKKYSIEDIEYIELPYGMLATTLNNAKTYSINLDTKKLEVTYYTEDELNEIQKQEEESQVGSNRVEDIKSYLDNADDTTVSKVEDTILETESNKVIENGGM